MQFYENAMEYSEKCGIAEAVASAPAVLCAFSGGADSSVLLHFLSEWLRDSGKKLCAAHVNHMIRGEDADADEAFCRKVCDKLGIELFVLKANVPEIARKNGEGLEEAARNVRYAFLGETAEKLGGALIATAHNATDNMETVLLNLTRGCAVNGLGGIDPIRDATPACGGRVIRPLLFASGEEIRDFAKKEKISYVTDKTNADTEYSRNLIRHTVVPNLRKINPRADSAFLRLSAAARADEESLSLTAKAFIGERKYIPRDEFSSLDRSVASRVVMLLCERENGRKDISEKNVSDILGLAFSDKVGKISVHGCDFNIHRDAVFVSKKAEVTKTAAPSPLTVGKFTEFGEYLVGIFEKEEDIPGTDGNIYNLFIHTTLGRGKMYGDLFVRSRQEGDIYLLHGVRRKLKKLMCDEKIPQRMRDSLPLVCCGDDIVLVPTLRAADGFSGNDMHILIYLKKESE